MSNTQSLGYYNAAQMLKKAWPSFLPKLSSPNTLDDVWVLPFEFREDEDIISGHSAFWFDVDLAFSIPGLDAVALSFAAGDGGTVLPIEINIQSNLTVKIEDVPIALRFRKDLLKPVRKTSAKKPGEPAGWEVDTSRKYVEIDLAKISLEINSDGDITLKTDLEINLPPAMIADTGIVIEAKKINISLDSSKPKGVYIKELSMYLPGELGAAVGNLSLQNAFIGNGGFSGTLTDTWPTPLKAELFGLKFSLNKVSIGFKQNALTSSCIHGKVTLPFFDKEIEVEIAINLNGAFTVKLGSKGIATLEKENVFKVTLDSLGFEVQDGFFTAKLSGEIKPLIGNLDWPSFQVNELTIDSKGNVRLDGGWMDLREQYSLDFYGFQFEITKLGFGKTEDNGKWIGFSGGLKLVDGLPVGASVEGLRITWYEDKDGKITDTKITLNGVGIEFEVPDVLRFKGEVAYRELPGDIHRFDGAIKLELTTLDMDLDGQLVIGIDKDEDYTFFAIYLGVEFPAGIPLWSTGLALYGVAGLFALQMKPDKKEHEEWYSLDRSKSWYHRDPVGAIELKKWKNVQDSLGLGAGITIGTISDNGYIISGKTTLAIVFPGPQIFIEGQADLLKKRPELKKPEVEPLFRALAVLDARAGTFLIGLDAQYKYGKGGELIEIGGSAEAFFNFNDASDWHLYLGQKEPREKRIHARILKLFGSSSYFMLDANSLAFGSWVGYGNSWKFGPLGVTLEAWMEYNVGVSWNPPHLHGDISVHGKAELAVFWFDLGLSLDAGLAADVFDPFHLKGELEVGINLPWPLPDFSVGITLEWGPRPDYPPLPKPLKEIAIEHFKVTKSWPLPPGKLLLPVYDKNEDGFIDTKQPGAAITPSKKDIPVVPLDCRPHITFSRPLHDDALVGLNPQPPQPAYERIGDPEKNKGPVKLRYGLKEVALQRWAGSTWDPTPVARKAAKWDSASARWVIDPNPPGVSELFGSWAPVPTMPDGGGKAVAQTKLWLWSKTPFDYTRHSGRFWDEWFIERFSGYPCIPIPQDKEICYDFENVQPSVNMISPWSHSDEKNLIFQWLYPQPLNVSVMPSPVDGRIHELCFPYKHPDETTTDSQEIIIKLPQPAKEVKLIVKTTEDIAVSDVTGYDASGKTVEPAVKSGSTIIVSGRERKQMITRVVVINNDADFCLLAVCISVGVSYDEISLRLAMEKHLRNEMARWEQTEVVLEPYTIYRLKIVTTLNAEGKGELFGYSENLKQEEFAYFQTEGPPGLTDRKLGSGLDDLVLYVKQTVPATVPAQGQKPVLPRPVYRAYDVGVEFNENYVDLMYRIAGSDLGLYLYDNNNRPVRDAQGRLIVLSNRWGETETLTPTKSDVRWIVTLNTSKCVPTLNLKSVPHDKTLTSAAEGQVLSADTVYEARLAPLLLHEDFSSFTVGTVVKGPAGKLDGWKVYDEGTKSGPSHWEIGKAGTPASFYIIQKSNIWGGDIDGTDAVKPGTYLLRDDDPKLSDKHPDQPSNWTDYRLSVYLRSTDDDVIGVVFRYVNPQKYFFFAMDRERKYRRLVRVVEGKHKILAQDDFVYVLDRDYLITVEAIGSSLCVYQDGAPVFNVTDTPITPGTIGLYCWGNMGARFSDVRVDDFRQKAPVAYRFNFTTSQFANFFHHIHSFQDETWQKKLPANTNIGTLLAKAVSLTAKPSEQEARDYQTLVAKVFGPTPRQNPKEVQVTRIEQNKQTLAFLVESPEPVDWKRTRLEVLYTNRSLPKLALPGTVKLTDITFGTTQPNQESVSLLLRDTTDLTRHHIEYRKLPGPVAESTGDPVMLADDFSNVDGGLLFREEFGPNALDHYTIVDEGSEYKPSHWMFERQATGGTYIPAIIQTSEIYGGSVTGEERELPGTMAVTGSEKWTNVRARVTLRSEVDGAIGVVFRYQDKKNYYLFSMGNFLTGSRYRLSKKRGEDFEILWEKEGPLELGRSYHLVIEAYGDRLLGYLDDALLFSMQDGDIAAGQVGYYCWQNSGAIFEALEVERLEADPLLWQPTFADLKELDITDEEDAIPGPSVWKTKNGVLTQSSNIHVLDNVAQSTIHRPGTYALGGSEDWEDIEISVRLRSDDDDAIGVMFRVSPQLGPDDEEIGHNYYRFSMDRKGGYRRLIKKVGDIVTQLWWDNVKYNMGQTYELTIQAVGSELRGYLDGELLFTRYDGDLKSGQVGLYCWANTGARFERVVVTGRTRYVGRWTIKDEGTVSAPSIWRIANDALLQMSDISGGSYPDYPGTYALVGDSRWTDYRMTVKLRSDDVGTVGVMFRYMDTANYYRLSIDQQANRCLLIKKENGTAHKIDEKHKGYIVGDTFTLTVDVIGPRLVCYMDDELLFDVIDTSHAAGKVGLYCWDNNATRFEEVEVRRPPLEAYALLRDRFAIGSKSGWSFINEGTEFGPSNWEIHEGALRQTTDIYSPPIDRDTLSKQGTQAAAGDLKWSDVIISARLESHDDDAIGLLFRYKDANHYYRFSMDSQRSYRRLVKNVGGNFTLLWEDDFAYEVDHTYELTIVAIGNTLRGYFDGVPMFVVEDGDLSSGRIGLYCWGNHDARFSQVRVYPANLIFKDWLLNETFDVLIPDRWTFVNEGDKQGPSQWKVTDGALRQTSNIYGGSTDGSVLEKPGTYALAGSAAWKDYRISVRLRSDDDDAIGVMFRYVDENNYYRFSMDRERSYRRLIKKVDGVVTKLWEGEDNVQYTLRREYILTLDCVGERLIGYLDGVQLFAKEDGELTSGRIGLYCWANTGARFAEVRVAAPVWAPYYTFGHEVPLPAGTRVQVYAGNKIDKHLEEAGVVKRFNASLSEHGQLRLPGKGADLRLRARGGTEGHTRHFLPDSPYVSVNALVLRKADGTGFFVLASPTGSALTYGQYRLEMTYRRDNRAVDPDGQAFSQAGVTDPERVTIDIPWTAD